ncbi:MAG: PLP-dependent aminotransferase family protein [Rhodobacteraceae bacterium]|nr:PLP-dependent aminotransferase family protein [Paracoccaceae bacterium]
MAVGEDTFFLDPGFQGSLQIQLQQIVASAILSGRFSPGDKMPSSRKLARHLGISRITVTLAYNELVADDYLSARAKSGYYVSDTAPVAPMPDQAPGPGADQVDWDRAIRHRYSGSRLVEKVPDWRAYPYPFIYGQADPDLFNQSSWRLCAHQALGRKDFDSLTADYSERDDSELIRFLARHTLPRRGILARPEQILITVGAQNALWLAAGILLGPGSHAAYEDPGYPGLRDILRHSEANLHPVLVDEAGLPPARLPDNTDVVFVTPSHQCPTTVTMPLERRHEVLRLAREREFIVVEDDYEFEMSFLNPPAPALKSLDRDGRVVYVGSFSKSLFPGLRLGYLVASEPLIAEARALRHAVLRHPPGHIQRTTAYFLARGHYDAMVSQMRDALHARRRVMAKALAASPLKVAGSAAFGGSSFWVETPTGTDTETLSRRLRKDGVLIEPGSPFFTDPAHGRSFCRLAYSSIPAERIPEGVARIARALG